MTRAFLWATAVLTFGATSFYAGTVVGSTSMEVSLVIDGSESTKGRLAIYEPSQWGGREVAKAICATKSNLDGFANTYGLFGSGVHYVFTCAEPGKDTL